MPFYYLSFCDTSLPAGQQFLGNTVIECPSEADIPIAALALGRNPGGEIAFVKLNVETADELPEEGLKYYERFVPRDEALAAPHTHDADEDDPDIRTGTICQHCNPHTGAA